MAATWKALIKGLKRLADIVAALDDMDKINTAGEELACGILKCTPRELDLLSSAFADNAQWFLTNWRGKQLSLACENRRTLQIMKDLFVEDKAKDLVFTTKESVIRGRIKAGWGSGLSWDGTSRIVRIRKNRIMNWGTTYTKLESGFVGDVLLVPATDITPYIVLFVGPELIADCANYVDVWQQLHFSRHGAIYFWGDLYALCVAIHTMRNEHECLTYSERVPCTVFRLSKQRGKLLPSITRKAISNLLKLQDTANS